MAGVTCSSTACSSLAVNTISTLKETEAKPALRISHIVYGREHAGNRVTYLIDPKGLGKKRAVPESVVLHRWRQRQFAGHRFSGSRLSATLWRAIAHALGQDATRLCRMSVDAITLAKEKARPGLGFLKLPTPDTLHALFAVCGPKRLQALINRHLSPEHAGLSGVPDLFVYAVNERTGKPTIARFVEVKKPEEAISRTQLAEIAILNRMGLHARVLRLDERTVSGKNA